MKTSTLYKMQKSNFKKEIFFETIKFLFLFITYIFRTYVINNRAYLIALIIPVGIFVYYFIQWIELHKNVFFSTL